MNIGLSPLTISTDSILLITNKHYMDELSSASYGNDAKVKNPTLISRFFNSSPKRKPITYLVKIMDIQQLNISNISSNQETRSIVSKHLIDYSIQEFKLNNMTDSITYEFPLTIDTSTISSTSSDEESEQLRRNTERRIEYLTCLNLNSANEWVENDCTFVSDSNNTNVGVCKCTRQA